MNKEMKHFYDSLIRVGVNTVNAAFEYVHNECQKLEEKGDLTFDITKQGTKNVLKEVKLLRKMDKKKNAHPELVLKEYEEGSMEHFYLYCIIRLLDQRIEL